MMDRELLLTELDASDAICSVRMDSLTFLNEFICHARTVLPERNQQLREALARIDELEAVVVPLERLATNGLVEVYFGCGDWFVEIENQETIDGNGGRYVFAKSTLAEALSAAVKAMEDAT